LKGNWFSIALRFIEASNEEISINVQNVKENGFINYFGLQRFGTYTIKTHEIGRYVLREDWKEVCKMIIWSASSPDDQERKERIVKYVFEDDDIMKGKELLSFRDRIEDTILDSLLENTNGFWNAFEKLSWNTWIIYVHAYQSYVWNRVVSEWIKRYGTKVLVGDLIIKAEKWVVEHWKKKEDIEVEDVDFVTEENLHNYSITDIVFPLIGKSI